MSVNCKCIGNLLVRLIANMLLNDNFEAQSINDEQTEGNVVIFIYSCSHIIYI